MRRLLALVLVLVLIGSAGAGMAQIFGPALYVAAPSGTGCSAWQFDLSDSTGCNMTGALVRGVY